MHAAVKELKHILGHPEWGEEDRPYSAASNLEQTLKMSSIDTCPDPERLLSAEELTVVQNRYAKNGACIVKLWGENRTVYRFDADALAEARASKPAQSSR